ncbi:MAG TPA: hypothetical protein VFK38_03045 [Candidatus Limnocylindrales bacterium]|nr:hypothetical protein [Candidatus Limnocylindrales bacterium]
MQPIHAANFHVSKLEYAQRLSRIEQERLAASAPKPASEAPTSHIRLIGKRAAVTFVAAMLSLIVAAGALAANSPQSGDSGGGCGGGRPVRLLC